MLKYLLSNTIASYKVKYQSSILGYAWVILHPLLLLLLFTFVFGEIMQARIDIDSNNAYALYLSVGILPWSVFVLSLSQATVSLVQNANYIKKINIPIYIFVFQIVLEQTFNMLVVIALLFIFLWLSGITFSFSWFLVLIPVVLLMLLSAGLGMLFAAINVFMRDMEQAITIFLQMLMWALPIVYPWEIIPEHFQWVIIYDPLFYYFNAMREVLLYEHIISVKYYLIMAITSGLVFLLGFWVINSLDSDIRDNL